jgi:Tol biopolymer transport system component
MDRRGLGATWAFLVLTVGAMHGAALARAKHLPSPRIVFVGYPADTNDVWLYSIRIDGTGLRRIDDATGWDPAVSPDRTQIAFTGGGGVDVIGVDGSGYRHLDGGPGVEAEGPAWSPDGKTIAFTRAGGLVPGGGGVWTMNPDGSSKRFLRLAPLDGYVPIKVAWFDAHHLVIPSGGRFAVIDSADGHLTRWITPPTAATGVPPAVSANHRELAYSECDGGRYCPATSVVVMSPQGRLIRTIRGADFGAWGPHGELLYTLRDRIMLAPADGGPSRAVTPASLSADDATWLG